MILVFAKKELVSAKAVRRPEPTWDPAFPYAPSIIPTISWAGKIMQRLMGGKQQLDDFNQQSTDVQHSGYSVFVDIPQPDPGCSLIVRSPASVDVQGCGVVVGAFKNAGCVNLVLKETFMAQFCCGSGDCSAAGVGKKMIRGMNYPRGGTLLGAGFRDANGKPIEPIQVGEPPEWKNPPQKERRDLARRDDCTYTPDGDLFTTNAPTQIVLTGVDGGTGGAEVKITQERSVSRSTTIEAGINWEIISASVSVTFEESITNGQEKTFTVPAGQAGKLGFTPIWKCTKGWSISVQHARM